MPAAGVVAEAMVALVLAEAVLEKFGGDSLGETRRNVEAYLDAPGRPRIDRHMSARVVLVGLPGAGKSTTGGGWRRSWPSRSPTPTTLVEAATRADRRARSSRRRRGGVPRARARRGGRAALETFAGVLALGGGALTTPRRGRR